MSGLTKFIKLAVGIISAIILGSIGSGFWERYLSKLWDGFLNYTNSLIFDFYGDYEDSLYQQAARGFNDGIEFSNSIILSVIIALLMLNILLMSFFHSYGSEVIEALADFFKHKLFIFISASLIFAVFFQTLERKVELSRINEVRVDFHTSLKIVRPYISERKYNEKVSKFHMMKNKKDYLQIRDYFELIAKSQSFELPKYDFMINDHSSKKN